MTKPLDTDALIAVVERAMEKARLLQETRALRERLRDRNAFKHIVTGDPKSRELIERVNQVGASKAHVIITGEGGTGKELIAEAIWAASPRADKPFVRLHCAALADHLLESELFGHEKGAFEGAVATREGRIKQADGGTLFLDEITALPLAAQAKLLRVLQDGVLERVGGNDPVRVDVRVLVSTQKDLKKEVEAGTFRDDLFYRLNVLSLEVPALRNRTADIGPLASFFLGRYASENGKSIDGFSDEALTHLTAYHWPGNVRELENAIERAVVLCDSPQIERRQLPASVSKEAAREGLPPIPGSTIDEIERYAILRTLESCSGSTSKAALVLGMSTRKIQYKLHEYSSRK